MGEEDVAQVLGDWTGIPVSKMLEAESEKLLKMEERLGARVRVQTDHEVRLEIWNVAHHHVDVVSDLLDFPLPLLAAGPGLLTQFVPGLDTRKNGFEPIPLQPFYTGFGKQ